MNAFVGNQPVGTPVRMESADFEEIVREHSSMVYSIAWRYLHDRSLAEEVAQEVFLQLHRDFKRLEDDLHVKHWLRRVAVHRATDQLRARRMRGQVSLEDAPALTSESREPDPLLSRLLRRLVASLPEQARMIVILRYQEELSPTEIAETLGIPARTVRTRLHRALVLLRAKAARAQGKGKS